MKNIYVKFSALLLAGVMTSTSCTKDFSAINQNPTSLTPTNVNPNTLLTGAQLFYSGSTDFAYENWRNNLGICIQYVQLMANPSFGPGDKYQLNITYNSSVWIKAYPEQVKTITELMEFTRGKAQYANLFQISRIMRAMILQRLTDMYGDIPYFEAGQGYNKRIFYPKYDKQSAIYPDLIKEFDEAGTAISLTGDKPTGDAMYGGDLQKWKNLAGSLILRAAMRLVKIDDAAAKAAATKAIGRTMTSIADNAWVKGSGTGIDRTTNNRNSQILLGDGGGNEHGTFKWSRTYIDFLKNNNDPRLTRIARVQVWPLPSSAGVFPVTPNAVPDATASKQQGFPNGVTTSATPVGFSIQTDPTWQVPAGAPNQNAALNNYSSPNPAMIQRTSPTFFYSYAESELLLAEAAVRWGSAFGDAATHYNAGVTAAMTGLAQYDASMAIPASEASAYLAANPYNPAKALEMINTQIWATLGAEFQGYEAWINWRRTGFPAITPINYPNNITGGTIPRRMLYPDEEIATNLENLNVAKAALPGGLDVLTSRVWWDKP